MTDKSIFIRLGSDIVIERETGIMSGSKASSKVMVFFLKYVVPSASAFPATVQR